ncbi:hypothetical protein L208DRAFT_898429 [Tricholoma matsutake]|nr:hypothetical protein L208DRAFT_898429 [Tricholoma matsutake 945]
MLGLELVASPPVVAVTLAEGGSQSEGDKDHGAEGLAGEKPYGTITTPVHAPDLSVDGNMPPAPSPFFEFPSTPIPPSPSVNTDVLPTVTSMPFTSMEETPPLDILKKCDEDIYGASIDEGFVGVESMEPVTPSVQPNASSSSSTTETSAVSPLLHISTPLIPPMAQVSLRRWTHSARISHWTMTKKNTGAAVTISIFCRSLSRQRKNRWRRTGYDCLRQQDHELGVLYFISIFICISFLEYMMPNFILGEPERRRKNSAAYPGSAQKPLTWILCHEP